MNVEGVTTVQGREPGKTLTIMAGVHGDEICGIKAIETFLKSSTIGSGKVHFIHGNPRAIEQNVRQVDMNLNRAFVPEDKLPKEHKNSYERRRALELTPYLRESDALLDIHSILSKENTPFIICEPHSYPLAERLPFGLRSHGWDIIEPGGTDYFMNSLGKIGICIECGQHLDPESSRRAQESITIFLSFMGVVPTSDSFPRSKQRTVHAYHIHITRVDFKLARQFVEFELLKNGEVIGYDGDEKVSAQSDDSVIIFCHNRSKPREEAFILGREEA